MTIFGKMEFLTCFSAMLWAQGGFCTKLNPACMIYWSNTSTRSHMFKHLVIFLRHPSGQLTKDAKSEQNFQVRPHLIGLNFTTDMATLIGRDLPNSNLGSCWGHVVYPDVWKYFSLEAYLSEERKAPGSSYPLQVIESCKSKFADILRVSITLQLKANRRFYSIQHLWNLQINTASVIEIFDFAW